MTAAFAVSRTAGEVYRGLAAAADDQDIFVPGVLVIFRAAGHGELFRLDQRDVPVRDRIDTGCNIRRRAP